MKAGVAISPDTPSTAVTDDIGNAADMILVMTVYPGKPSPPQFTKSNLISILIFNTLPLTGRGGQKFIERCVPKVSELRARFPNKDIEVDGGVGPNTVGQCADAGQSAKKSIFPISLFPCFPVSPFFPFLCLSCFSQGQGSYISLNSIYLF